jgi:hypothetical protein
MDIPASVEDHSDSEPRKLSEVRLLITDYAEKTFNVEMQPYYEHLKTPTKHWLDENEIGYYNFDNYSVGKINCMEALAL